MDNADNGSRVTTETARWVETTRRLNATSVTKLAQSVGVSRQALTRRLSGEVAFDLPQLVRIAQFYGVKVSDITAAAEDAAAA